ncbi:hypothetical protein [Streptomyces sp. AD55]|uniref:hypothetical protein n=1 Tax=Streptomyces sp. AD55 TaxID=3242895 RepID=UPI0035290086
MRYFLNPATGGWMTLSGDSSVFDPVPAGYREVSEAEYNEAVGTIVLAPPSGQPAPETDG